MKKVTITQIAKETGLSIGTVSNVINNSSSVKEKNRKKVLEAIKKNNYIPNKIASSLVRGKTKNIGFIIPDIMNPYFPDILRGVQDFLIKKGYYIFLFNSDGDIEKEDAYLDDLIEMRVDGIILDTASSFRNIDVLKKIEVPIVLMDRKIEGYENDAIVVDNEVGAYEMTKLLINYGHKKILHLGGPRILGTTLLRKNGWKKAMEDNGLVTEGLLFWESASINEGYNLMEKIIKRVIDFDSVFASNDVTAIGVMNCLEENGYKCPEEVSIVGFDDINMAKYMKPSLTTYKNYTYRMGTKAGEVIIKKIESGEKASEGEILVKGKVIIRNSIAKVVSK